MITLRAILLTLCLAVFVLAACVPTSNGDTQIDSNIIPNDEGGALLIEATRAAQRAISDRKTATIQYATMYAESTKQASEHQATGTAQAIWMYQQQRDARATDQAIAIQSAQTRQAATDTAIAHSSQATGTAEADALIVVTTHTAAAIQATATTFAATQTRGAQEIQAALERHQATATAEALEIRRAQAQADAARSQAWATFFDSFLKILVGLGGLAFLIMLWVQIARYLDSLSMRQRILETRAGTVLIIPSRNGYSAELIKPTPNLLDSGNDFEPSQAAMIETQAPEVFKLSTARGETFITKTDPEQEAREVQRRLALRLLRESIRHYSNQRMDAREVNRIPSFRDLGWSSETWVRAVQSLKPYVIATQGRGGGTYCGVEFPSVMTLYTAVGERRIMLGGELSHSPTLERVAA